MQLEAFNLFLQGDPIPRPLHTRVISFPIRLPDLISGQLLSAMQRREHVDSCSIFAFGSLIHCHRVACRGTAAPLLVSQNCFVEHVNRVL